MGKKSGFDLKELMNQRSLEKTGQQDTEYIEDDMEIVTLDVYDLVPSKDNFYSLEDIESLKSSIARFGLLQPILVRPDEGDGKHDIKAGHRRRLACISLVEDENLEKYRYVPCVIKREEEYANADTEDEKRLNAVLERLELIEANMFRDKSEWEKMEEALQQEELIEELRKVIKLTGRTRTILKEFTDGKIKEAQMGRYKVIKKNLCTELMEELINWMPSSNRFINPTCRVRPVSSTSRSISWHSSTVTPMGFSTNTCFPARSACLAHEAWNWSPMPISTASISLSSSISL